MSAGYNAQFLCVGFTPSVMIHARHLRKGWLWDSTIQCRTYNIWVVSSKEPTESAVTVRALVVGKHLLTRKG
jgi:hypothetical protein